MDWRNRKYYCVSFDWAAEDMRLGILQLVQGLRLHGYKYVPKQKDEIEERGKYDWLISVPACWSEAVEYELRKAARNDAYCIWKEIKQVIKV